MQETVWQNVFIQTLWLKLKLFCTCLAWTLLRGKASGGKGGTIPRVPKSSNNVASTFFSAVNLLPKDIGSIKEEPNLFLVPGAI